MEAARERVVARQDTDTHVGWLLGRIREERVGRVLEPIVVAWDGGSEHLA